jgi:hypothetical protein
MKKVHVKCYNLYPVPNIIGLIKVKEDNMVGTSIILETRKA